jgi:hypothetical protein
LYFKEFLWFFGWYMTGLYIPITVYTSPVNTILS